MTEVIQPKKQERRSILGVAGGVVGGIYGGPSGAMQGYQMGSSVGGMLGQNNSQQPTAVERRMGTSMPAPQPAENNEQALTEARLALQSQPPEVRSQYEPTLQAAMLKQRRQNGIA